MTHRLCEGVDHESAPARQDTDCTSHAFEWQVHSACEVESQTQLPQEQLAKPANRELEEELAESREEVVRLHEQLLRKHDEACRVNCHVNSLASLCFRSHLRYPRPSQCEIYFADVRQ